MGYLGNHLATVVCGLFAAFLTGLWYIMVPTFPVLDFIFMMAVPITWFLVFACWLAQKSNDYTTKHSSHEEEKKHNSLVSAKQVYKSDGKLTTT